MNTTYRPLSAMQRAEEAIAVNPGLSDRAIAAEIGVDHKTVGKARMRTGDNSPVDKRIGRDGIARKVPPPPPEETRIVGLNDQQKCELYEAADDEMKRWAEQYFDWPKKRRDEAWMIIINHNHYGEKDPRRHRKSLNIPWAKRPSQVTGRQK